MSKKSNPALIGAFVIGAASLIVIAVALLGGAQYFAKRLEYVAYFDESTKGLRVGSNVILNGVRVGYVSDVALLVDQSTYQTLTQVTMEILPEDLVMTDFGEVIYTEARRKPLGHDDLVRSAGMRAQLETESFVTGQLVVRLDFRPETPAIYRGHEAPHPEIPTIPSNVQALIAKLRVWTEKLGEDFDIDEIADRISNILLGLEGITNSEDLRQFLAGVNQLANDEQTRALAANLNRTLDEVRGAAGDTRALIQTADDQVTAIAGDIRPALNSLAGMLEETERTLAEAREVLRGESVQMYQLQATLQEVESAALALREFFDYLERNPEALLSGKKP